MYKNIYLYYIGNTANTENILVGGGLIRVEGSISQKKETRKVGGRFTQFTREREREREARIRRYYCPNPLPRTEQRDLLLSFWSLNLGPGDQPCSSRIEERFTSDFDSRNERPRDPWIQQQRDPFTREKKVRMFASLKSQRRHCRHEIVPRD